MGATRRRVAVAIFIVVVGLCAATACDANPSHVYVNTWSGQPWRVQNDTAYEARIDRAEVRRSVPTASDPCPADATETTPVTFSQTTVAARGGSAPLPDFDKSGGTVTFRAYFTLLGSRGVDGAPVTGVAEMTWVACAIQ
jgi:hypothetical protein